MIEFARSWKEDPPTTAVFLLFAAIAFLVYFPALNGGFIWDDVSFIVQNPMLVGQGVLSKIWLSKDSQDYWPLTYTALWLERSFFGSETIYYHLVNVFLHSLACTLIWRILVHLKFRFPLAVALLFCVSPVNVESVAWIFQIKTLLAAILILGSTLFYLREIEIQSRSNLAISLILFICANLSKISGITWPVILLGLEWYLGHHKFNRNSFKRLTPFFLVSLALGTLNVLWYPDRKFLPTYEAIRQDGIAGRLAGVGQNFVFYVFRVFYPGNTMFVYPRWSIEPENLWAWIPTTLLLSAALVFLLNIKSRVNPTMIFLAYSFVSLSPILGFFEVSFMRYSWVADHYLYLTVPAAMALGLIYLNYFFDKRPLALTVGILSIVLSFGVFSFVRSADYLSAESLWTKTLEQNPKAWVAHHELAMIWFKRGETDRSIVGYREALRINEKLPETHYNLGNALAQEKKFDEAMASYSRAIELRQRFPEAYFNMAHVLEARGDRLEAIDHYKRAISINPNYAEANYDIARILADLDRTDEAVGFYKEAIRLRPAFAEAHFNIALLFLKSGHRNFAIQEYELLQDLNPQYANVLKQALF